MKNSKIVKFTARKKRDSNNLFNDSILNKYNRFHEQWLSLSHMNSFEFTEQKPQKFSGNGTWRNEL